MRAAPARDRMALGGRRACLFDERRPALACERRELVALCLLFRRIWGFLYRARSRQLRFVSNGGRSCTTAACSSKARPTRSETRNPGSTCGGSTEAAMALACSGEARRAGRARSSRLTNLDVHSAGGTCCRGVATVARSRRAGVSSQWLGSRLSECHHRLVPARAPSGSRQDIWVPPNGSQSRIGYVPQGRRSGPRSRSTAPRLAQRSAGRGPWTSPASQLFAPGERKTEDAGGQLSGGEQQCWRWPRPAVEPGCWSWTTDGGLAPVIVDQWSTC